MLLGPEPHKKPRAISLEGGPSLRFLARPMELSKTIVLRPSKYPPQISSRKKRDNGLRLVRESQDVLASAVATVFDHDHRKRQDPLICDRHRALPVNSAGACVEESSGRRKRGQNRGILDLGERRWTVKTRNLMVALFDSSAQQMIDHTSTFRWREKGWRINKRFL